MAADEAAALWKSGPEGSGSSALDFLAGGDDAVTAEELEVDKLAKVGEVDDGGSVGCPGAMAAR